MRAKKQLGHRRQAMQRVTFASARWRELARRLVHRYRSRRKHVELTVQWLRPLARRRWLRERWLAPVAAPQWWINFPVNVHIHDNAGGIQPVPLLREAKAQKTFRAQRKRTPHTRRPLISRHFAMERFVQSQVIMALEPVNMIAERVVHTAVRPIVREALRTEQRIISQAAADRAREAEVKSPERVLPSAFVIEKSGVPTPRISEINIAQITDQVMRQLDHRISSWRERRGRS